MRSADLIREARLRAGLTQHELAERSGRDRSVIARWEQGVVAPSVETLVELARACGFDLPLELVPDDPSADARLRKSAMLSPERRVQRFLQARSKAGVAEPPPLDPYAILAALERRRVGYVLIGGFARIINGADELTDGLDITPSLRDPNLARLELALAELGVTSPSVSDEPVAVHRTASGELKIVGEPAGTRGGYDDLRRAGTREPIGRGLRPTVASPGDLARMLAALGRDHDTSKLRALRRLTEIERTLGHGPLR